jgi:uncharacterized protein (TIRG00374 family)
VAPDVLEASEAAGEGAGAERRRPSSTRRVLSVTLTIVVVGGTFFGVLPRIADFSDVWQQIRDMTWLEIATLTAAAVWNLVTYSFGLVPSLPGLSYGQAFVVAESSTAIANTLPAGAGLGFGASWAMYSSWGFRRQAIAQSLLVTGVWNLFAKLAFPVVALALLALEDDVGPGEVSAAGVGFAVLVAAIGTFAVMLRSESGARRVGGVVQAVVNRARRLVRKSPTTNIVESIVDFRETTVGLLRKKWLPLTIGTTVSQLSLYLVLLLTLRHIGVSDDEVGWAEVLAAFSIVRLVSAIPITPGGIGVVELALVGALVAGGGEESEVVAAVLVFRALTWIVPIPVGAVTYLIWRGRSGWRRPPDAEDLTAPPAG